MIKSLRAVGVILVGSVFNAGPSVQTQQTTYEVVQRGRHCTPNETDKQQIDCEYRIGKSLRFSVAGVGTPDAGIVFEKSDIDGDFYAAFGVQHGCVIVWPGGARNKQASKNAHDLAFVSPADGQVYRDWMPCAAARR